MRRGIAIHSAAVALALSHPACAATFAVTDLGALSSADASTTASALNAKGQVAGASGHPFLYSAGALIDLNASLSASVFSPCFARGVNDSGVVVGAFTSGAVRHPFRWAAGTWTDLDATAAVSEEAVAVNSAGDIAVAGPQGFVRKADGSRVNLAGPTAGSAFAPADMNDALQVVGCATAPDHTNHASLWQNGAAADLGVLPGDFNSAARGINAQGWVVGVSYGAAASSTLHAFLYRDGAMSALPPRTAGESCVATAVNAAGLVVGYAGTLTEGSGETAALLWRNGQVCALQTLIPSDSGWTLLAARDINDAGQVVGYGIHNGAYRAFLLTPAPVPGDANGDLAVTPQDASLVLQMSVGAVPAGGISNLDVAPSPSAAVAGYGDGRVDVLDALRILRQSSGLEAHWP